MEQLNLKLTLNRNGSITANWSKITGVKRYAAFIYPVGKSYAVLNETKLTTTTCTSRANLEANQQYQVIVTAYGDYKVLASDGKKILIKSDFYKIDTPKNVKATAAVTTVTVSFDKVSAADSYDILFDGVTYKLTGTSKKFWQLEPKSSHTYAVRAKNLYKTSAYSKTQTITTQPRTPSVPAGISKSSTESTATISWRASTAATGYDLVFGGKAYKVKGTSKTFTGLTANKSYSFKLRATSADAVSKYTAVQTVKTTSCAPASTKATVNEKSVKISWSAVAGATGYDILFNGKVYSVTGTSKTFNNLDANNSYTYQIRVKNAHGVSSYSEPKTVKTTPLPPTEFTSSVTKDSVTLSWDAVPGATSYDVVFNGKTYRVTGTTLTVNGLTSGKKYTYKIRVNNADGSSSYSTAKSVTTLAKPKVPTGISATATGNSVEIKWGAVDKATDYDVWFDGTVYNVKGCSKKIEGLSQTTSYKYKVRAKNSAGASAYSAVKTIKTLIMPPSVPANVNATATTNTMTITWDAVPEAKTYTVKVDGTFLSVFEEITLDTKETSITLPKLDPGTNYHYSVCANNAGGSSAFTAKKAIKTKPVVPKVPYAVIANATANSVTVEWIGDTQAESYDVLFQGKVYNTTECKKTISGLKANTQYSCQVRAKNEAGVSVYSDVESVRTLLETPANISVKAKAKTVTISFSPVNGATSYDIVFNGKTYNVTNTSKEITGLQPKTTYTFFVCAKNAYVQSKQSNKVSVTTLPPGPAVPSDVEATATMNSIIVSFSPVEEATDYDVEFDGVAYHVTEGGEIIFIGEEQKETDSVEAFSVKSLDETDVKAQSEMVEQTDSERIYTVFAGLAPDTKHTYCARANNAEGSSLYSERKSIYTEMESRNGMKEETSRSTYPNGKLFYTGADPVNALTGAFLWSYTWLENHGKDELSFTTMYDSQRDDSANVLGKKWTYSLNYLLNMDEKYAYFSDPAGGVTAFRINKEMGTFESTSSTPSSYSMKKNDDGSYSVWERGGTEYIFDSQCCLNRIEKNGLTEYQFTTDMEGRIVRIEGRHGASLNLTYTGTRILSVADAMGNKVTFTYKKKCLGAIVNADGKGMTFTYDKAFNLLAISDFAGKLYLTNKYDVHDRVTEQQTAGRGRSLVAYDTKNKTTTFTNELGNDTKYTYDENGHIIKVELAGAGIQNSYNVYGQLTKRTDALGNVTQMEYDACGRMTHIIHPDGTEEQVEYNVRNLPTKVINRDGTITMYYYDLRNNPIAVQDERGNSSTYTYDKNDNLTSFTDKKGNVWNYVYDENNHLKEVTDPEGNIYRYSHDTIGRLTHYTSPEGRSLSYMYSAAGDLLSMEDADGTILFEYNENGSRTGITDRMGNKQCLEYNEMGQVSMVTDFMGNEYRFEYDAKGNLIKETDPNGKSITYTYDAMGNRTAWKDKNGNTTGFTFDAANRLTEVKDAAGGTVKYVYDTMGQVKTVIDPLKHQTAYTYDYAGRVICVTNALGHSVHYTYDKTGNLLTKTDEDGVVTAYEYDEESRLILMKSDAGTVRFVYDSLGRVVLVEDVDEQVEAAAYDGDGNLTIALDKENNRTTYAYDHAGRLIEEIAPNGGKTAYAYDKNGNCVKVTDAEENEYCYEYDANNRLVKVTNPLKQETSYCYDATGKLLSVTDAGGGRIDFVYDANGNLIQETNALGGVKVYTYDNLNRLVKSVDEEGHRRSFAYDTAGNLTSYTDANENRWVCVYDALNRVTSVIGQDDGALTLAYTKTGRIAKVKDQEGAETSYLYDSMGRLTEMSDALGHSLSFTYDRKGRVLTQTDANGNTTEYSYSPTGNLLEVKYPEGDTVTYTYNALGQILTATDALGNTVSYEYDVLGQVTAITDGEGGKTAFTYTDTGRIATVTDADGGVIKYSYDACGNLVQAVDPLGNVTEYEYDAMNNQIKECLSGSGEQTCVTLYRYDKRGFRVHELDPMSEEKTYTYDGNGNMVARVDEEKNESTVRYDLNNRPVQIHYGDGKEVTFRYNKRGELVEMKDWNGLVSMERDRLGRITKVTDPEGHATGYTYDAVGNRTGIQYPDGSKVSYVYDKNNRLSGVTDGEGQTAQYAYDAAGNVLSVSQPGSTAAYAYNARRQPVTAEYRFDDGTMMTDNFTYDLLGRMTGSERKGTTEELTGSAEYAYDALGQLVSYREGQNTETYVYDALGNRISKAVNGVQKSAYRYNQMNQLISMMEEGISYSFGYDRRGNLTEERKGDSLLRSYTYDVTNRMVFGKNMESGETTEYGYNGLMMRVRNVQTFMEDGTSRIKETGYVADYLSRNRNELMAYETGVGVTRNVYGRGYEGLSSKLIPELPTATGEKKYFRSDLYGSPLLVADEEGKVQKYAGRSIWGEVTGTESDELRFTTYSYDRVIGKYFAQARFYDSSQGRMLAKDPVKRGMNAYPYCDNDPVNLVDPDGKFVINHLARSFGAGVFDGLCDFGESVWNQYQNGEDIDWLEALGSGARGFVKGTAEEFFLGGKTKRWVTAVVDFGAGTLGSLAAQLISGEEIDFGDALYDGLLNTVEGQAFGKQSVKGIGDAWKRGARAGAATSVVDKIHGALFQGKSGSGAGVAAGGLGAVINQVVPQISQRDPRTVCGSQNPLSINWNTTGKVNGYQPGILGGTQTSKTPTLKDTVEDIVHDTIWGGFGSAAQYVGGEVVDGFGGWISKRWNKSGSKADVTTGLGYDAGDAPVRIEGDWSINDMKQALLGHPPRGLGSPDIHHGGQMPGAAKHEIIPSQHRNNSALHLNKYNQGVTPDMRASDRELHWWYRAREQGADDLLPDWIYDN